MPNMFHPNHHILPSRKSPMSRMKTFRSIKGTKLADTGKAIKFSITEISGTPLEKEVTHWFPISQIDKIFTDPESIGNDSLVVTEWILKERGLA